VKIRLIAGLILASLSGLVGCGVEASAGVSPTAGYTVRAAFAAEAGASETTFDADGSTFLVDNRRRLSRGGTYLHVHPRSDRVMRSGRTNDLRRREREHARDPNLGRYNFETDRRTDSYPAQRGREQMLHDRYRPLLNQREPISPTNPRRQEYMRRGGAL